MVAKTVPNGPSAGFSRGSRLRKHADFQLVYQQPKKTFSGNITALYRVRPGDEGSGPRVGFAVGKALGGAVTRNRIRRRMRAAVGEHIATVNRPVDIVMHPRKSVFDMDFLKLKAEIQKILAAVQKGAAR